MFRLAQHITRGYDAIIPFTDFSDLIRFWNLLYLLFYTWWEFGFIAHATRALCI